MPADDDAAGGPPPHPLDRTWLHPTEIGGAGGPARPDPRPTVRPDGSTRGRSGRPVLAVVVVLLVGTVAALALVGTDTQGPPGTAARRTASARNGPVVDVAAAATRSVVAVNRPGPDGVEAATGSGVVVTSRRVVSAAHLVTGADAVGIVTADGRTLTATVVGTDPDTDLALLKVPEDLVPIETASDPRLGVGRPVVRVEHTAAAAPFPGVTTGTVVAVDAYVPGADRFVVGLVRTEPRAGVGAGGAVLDRSGRLAGVLVAAGDVVPSDVVRDVVGQLADDGRAYHGALHVTVVDATDRAGGGARAVTDARTDARADADARIRRGDVVVTVAGRPVATAAALAAAVRRLRPGDPVEVVVLRGGERLRLGVVLVPSPVDVDPAGPLVA